MAPPVVNTRLTRDLVLALIPPLKDDPTVLKQVTDHIAREVKADVQGSSRNTWGEVEGSIAGLARTARVRVQSDLADALDKVAGVLGRHMEKGEAAWEGDMPLKMSNLPQHVQFLLAISNQPNSKTHDLAHEYLHREPPQVVDHDRLLYDEIMADPFEGEHWGKGYDEEVREGWTDSESSGSDREGERIITPLRERVGAIPSQSQPDQDEGEMKLREAEEKMKNLGDGYWMTGGRVVESREVGEGWRAVSTGGSVASLALAVDGTAKLGVKAISGQQLQRELLFALSGRPGLMLDFYPDGNCFIVSDHPTVVHYSPVTVTSVLTGIHSRATHASLLRRYIQTTLSPITSSSQKGPTKTAQAFAEACRVFVGRLDTWLSELELAFVRGTVDTTASTPLSLHRQLDEKYGVMLDCLSSLLPYTSEPNDLLNALHSMMNTIPRYRSELVQVFVATASPIWAMLGDWLIRGMPIPRSLIDLDTTSDFERKLDPEFWVHRDQDVSWADEDFWEAAFLLREERPAWIDNQVLDLVLEAGKARGLLRGLLGREIEGSSEGWRSLANLVDEEEMDHFDLSEIVSEHLKPICQLTTFHLRRTLDEDCGLQEHLEAIDGLFYLKGYGTLQPWTEWLFSQVTSRKRWADFQVLTSTIREMIEKQNEHWLNPHAIRIRTIGRPTSQDPTALISPETLSIIKATYQVPFPLSQLFTSTSLDLRADVFVFLLQVQFGRSLLDQTKAYESSKSTDMAYLLRLRHRLYWVINTITVWITERVIGLETEKYKMKLDNMTSFGEMIQLELKHVRQMREFAFQHTRTASLNESLKSILEMTSTVHDLLFTLSQTASSSPPPPNSKYIQGRSRRRQRRQLAQSTRRRAESSDSESSDEEDVKANRTLGGEISFAQLSLRERVNRVQDDLGSAVVVLKEGVAELARGEEGDEGSAEVWGMLAFALEDWR